MIKLFVVGYPLDTQDADLIALFSIHGMVHSIQLLTDKVTHKQKGFGFIEMVDQAGADRAISALNGIVIKGRKVTVKLADENRTEKPRTFKPRHFPSQDGQNDLASSDQSKSRRPRKLKSDTFRAGE